MRVVLPLMRNVLTPLAKSISKEIESSLIKMIIPNEEMKNMLEIADSKSLVYWMKVLAK